MYSIIGGDGREYGPVTADQIRQWMVAGRANLDTQAKAAGTDDWRPLRDFPDFAGSAPPPDLSGGVAAPMTASRSAAFDPLDCFSRGWALLRANFWEFVGISVLVMVVVFGLQMISVFVLPNPSSPRPSLADLPTFLGAFSARFALGLLVINPFQTGYFYYLLRKSRGEAAQFGDLFAGFTRAWPQLVAANILVSILVALGFICLIVPGIYLGVAYSLTGVAIIDRRCGPWTGMELSRRSVTRRWWSVLLLFILGMLVVIAGACALLVGLFVALPLVGVAMVYAYRDLVE